MENGTRQGRGFTLWFTGLSGAGKTTIADIVEHELRVRFRRIEVLDGDIVRTNLSKGLGFSREDRDTNVLRIGFVADLLTRNGVGVIVSAISPFKEVRDRVRRNIGEDFIEVFVDAPLEVCAERDVKGLYKKAFSGEIRSHGGRDRHGLRYPDQADRVGPTLPPAVGEFGGRLVLGPREHPGRATRGGDPGVDGALLRSRAA
jgi:adenylylsulfate kinase